MGTPFKILISVAAIALIAVHQFFPSVKMDATSSLLIGVAILPWLLKYAKGFEIPGVIKIDLKDAKAATDKVTQAQPSAASIDVVGHKPTLKRTPPDPLANLRTVFESDPNLALVGFRIEIEQRLRQLAANHEVPDGRGLQRLVRSLAEKQVLAPEVASGLLELVALGNQAAHGVKVSSDAAAWVLDVGPSILIQLDALNESKNG